MDKDSEVTSDKYGEQVEGFENIAGGAIKLNAVTSEVDMNPGILDEDPEARKRLYQAGKEFNETYNKNVDYMIEGWHRPEVAKKEALILEKEIVKEKDPEMKNLLIARHGYLEKEAHPLNTLKENFNKAGLKGFITGAVIKTAMSTPQGRAIVIGVIGIKVGYDIYQESRKPKIAITSKQANDIKKIAPEFYKDAEKSFVISKKSDVSNSALVGAAEYYYKNNKTPDGKAGDAVGFLMGAEAGGGFVTTVLNNRPSVYIMKENTSLVAANINKGEQLFLEYKPNMFPVVYKPGSTLPVLYDNSKLFSAPVANNSIFTYTPLLITGGVNKIGQVQNISIPKNTINNVDLLKAFKNTEDKKNYYYSKLTTTMDIAGVKFKFPSIEYALNERAAEELQKNQLTMPIEMQEHIFGEIKYLRNGTIKATGGHAVSDQVKISDITNIQYNNVFQAKVEIYDPVTNQYILKSNNNGLSTFFPVYWTRERILIEAESAFGNKAPHSNPNMLNKGFYEGKTKSGVKVDIGRKTLYPQERQ